MRFLILVLTLVLAACASRPQLYPNDKLKKVGKEASQKDIDQCIADADNYVDSSTGKDMAKGAGGGAVVGGAAGAASGIFSGNIGGGLLKGAVIGGAVGGAAGALKPDEVKHNYVNKCLKDKGYDVVGWN